ncbi:MAG: aminopeptidase, partial [Thermoplasmata archaeon]|nr:aminopeptidase [Thermoplasmata archaeon]
EDERAWWSGIDSRKTKPLGRMSRSERAALAAANVYIYFWGPEDRPRADALPERVGGSAMAFNEEWYRIGRKGKLRGCRMSVAYATDPLATKIGVDGTRWRRQIATAGLADSGRMYATGREIARRLQSGKELRIHHKNGTDLTLGLAGYQPRVESGLIDKDAMARPYGFLANSPAGTVIVGLDERRGDGTVVANTPYIMPTQKVGTGRWELSGGRLVSFSFDDDGTEVESGYRAAGSGKDRPALLSIGLNPKARGVPQYEEIESGTVLLGTGGNAFLGGKTALPYQLYSMLRGADVEVDGTPIVHGGRVG